MVFLCHNNLNPKIGVLTMDEKTFAHRIKRDKRNFEEALKNLTNNENYYGEDTWVVLEDHKLLLDEIIAKKPIEEAPLPEAFKRSK